MGPTMGLSVTYIVYIRYFIENSLAISIPGTIDIQSQSVKGVDIQSQLQLLILNKQKYKLNKADTQE